jgi:gluconolactonase
MAVDSAGNICVGTLFGGGVTVVSPEGYLVGFVPLPEPDPWVTNICFGGDDYQLAYATAGGHGRVWEIRWPRPGHRLHYSERANVECRTV